MLNENLRFIEAVDPETASAIRAEYARETDGLEMIASESR